MKVIATYVGQDGRGHHLLRDVLVDGAARDHHWLNGSRSNFPAGVPVGSRVRFFASPVMTRAGSRLTDVRDLVICDRL